MPEPPEKPAAPTPAAPTPAATVTPAPEQEPAKPAPPIDPPTQVRMQAVKPPTRLMAAVEPPDEPATEPPTVPATEPAEKPDAKAGPPRGNGRRVPPQRARRGAAAKR